MVLLEKPSMGHKWQSDSIDLSIQYSLCDNSVIHVPDDGFSFVCGLKWLKWYDKSQ